MMALRSNAPHFWAWAADNAQKYLPREALEFSGFVFGDAHHENFAHYFFGPNRVYVPNDFDDSGVAPFFLDLLKFVGVSHSVFRDEKKISTELMIDPTSAASRASVGERAFLNLSLKTLGSAAQNWISFILKRSKRRPKPATSFPTKA